MYAFGTVTMYALPPFRIVPLNLMLSTVDHLMYVSIHIGVYKYFYT